MPRKTVRLTDLRSATEASVKSVLGRKAAVRPGVLVGLWVDKPSIEGVGPSPMRVARRVASQVFLATGIRVRPAVRTDGGGVTIGYVVPEVWNIRP